MDPYGTHLTVLSEIMKTLGADCSVLEFGCGLNSTPLLVSKAREVTSVEMQSVEWADKVASLLNDCSDKLSLVRAIGAFAYKDVPLLFSKRYDLVLVDGHGDSRWAVANDCFSITDIIVLHDTEEPGYRWDKIVIPDGWRTITYREVTPHTTVLTSNSNLMRLGPATLVAAQ
jgi:hypothetical protein